MKKNDFQKIEEKYNKGRARLQGIKKGDLVWETAAREGLEMDYHPAVVKNVNVDEDYVDVIDVTRDNEEFRYEFFLIESEMIERGFSKEILEEERKKYSGIIKRIMKGEKCQINQ